MTIKACAVCVKRHLEHGRLECRANPPAQDVTLYAQFPAVRPEWFCHNDFELDTAALEAVTAPVLDEAGKELNPPAGDLQADIKAPPALKTDAAHSEPDEPTADEAPEGDRRALLAEPDEGKPKRKAAKAPPAETSK